MKLASPSPYLSRRTTSYCPLGRQTFLETGTNAFKFGEVATWLSFLSTTLHDNSSAFLSDLTLTVMHPVLSFLEEVTKFKWFD